MVQHSDFARAGLFAEADKLRHYLWICRGGLVWPAGPSDVGLDENALALSYELADATESLNTRAYEFGRAFLGGDGDSGSDGGLDVHSAEQLPNPKRPDPKGRRASEKLAARDFSSHNQSLCNSSLRDMIPAGPRIGTPSREYAASKPPNELLGCLLLRRTRTGLLLFHRLLLCREGLLSLFLTLLEVSQPLCLSLHKLLLAQAAEGHLKLAVK